MPDMTFYVDVACQSATCAEAQTRGFTFNVDEPEQMGGTNTGPNPVEYVIGAYAGCLNVVSHMVAKEMGFDIDSLKIHIEGDLDPSGFMGQNPNVPGVQGDSRQLRRGDVSRSADPRQVACDRQHPLSCGRQPEKPDADQDIDDKRVATT